MKVTIAGDFCVTNRLVTLFNNGDYESALGEVASYTLHSDYSILNLECPIVKDIASPIKKHGPNLCCTPSALKAIRYAGFSCVTLANNHFYDYGEVGVCDTLSELDSEGFDYVGGGKNISQASKTKYVKVGNSTIAIINCCETEFSIATETSGGSNPLNPIRQYYAIREARQQSDYVLVIVHGGPELYNLPTMRMKETYRFFIDAGADAVICHHQHCYSGYEIYNKKPIFYGLGNFCFDANPIRNDYWNMGYMVTLSLEAGNVSFSLQPYRQCSENPKVHLLPVGAFDNELIALNSIIDDDEQLKKKNKEYYSVSARPCSEILEPIQNRYYIIGLRKGFFPSFIPKKNLLRIANYLRCESHFDKLRWWVDNKLDKE